jgi:ribulose-phosphate 3-epimerase
MPVVVPAILEKTKEGVDRKLELLNGLTDYVQLDIVDNWTDADKTVGLKELRQVNRLGAFTKEIHLMVKEPVDYLEDCRQLGATIVYGQIEQMSDQRQFVQACHKQNLSAGLAVDLPTFLSRLDKNRLPEIDGLLLFAVKAGAQNQKFSRKVIGKLKRVVRWKKEHRLKLNLMVDGGINPQTAKWCVSNGANQIAVGSFLLRADDIRKNMGLLVEVCKIGNRI